MKIKVYLITCFLIFGSIAADAQTYKETIRTDFNSYLKTIESGEFEKSVEYLTPKFFEILPKADMIQMMEQAFSNPDIRFGFRDNKILSVGDAREIEGKYYATLRYSNMMDIRLVKDDENQSKAERQTNDSLMMAGFEESFGAENVTYNTDTGIYEIYVEKDVWAISANGKTDWKFLVIENGQEMILKQILPEELIKAD